MKIQVQICDWCNKPHSGRRKVEDRCICESSGHYHWGEIEEEIEPAELNVNMLKYDK